MILSISPSSVDTKFSGPFFNDSTKSWTSFIAGPVMMRSSTYCYVWAGLLFWVRQSKLRLTNGFVFHDQLFLFYCFEHVLELISVDRSFREYDSCHFMCRSGFNFVGVGKFQVRRALLSGSMLT